MTPTHARGVIRLTSVIGPVSNILSVINRCGGQCPGHRVGRGVDEGDGVGARGRREEIKGADKNASREKLSPYHVTRRRRRCISPAGARRENCIRR